MLQMWVITNAKNVARKGDDVALKIKAWATLIKELGCEYECMVRFGMVHRDFDDETLDNDIALISS